MSAKSTEKLHKVEFKNPMSCVEYAIRRIGSKSDAYNYEMLMDSDEFMVMPFDRTKVKVGDVVLWDKSVRQSACPSYITADGVFVTTKLCVSYHVGVVENDMLVSDYNKDVPDFVQFQTLSTLNPDKILRKI